MKKTFYILILSIFCLSAVAAAKETIRTHSGNINGAIEENVRIYLGIPYAAPPIDNLRWKAPQEVKPWKFDRECTEYGLACPQPKSSSNVGQMDEDCLYLNIWAPRKKVGTSLPVMFWIHGGGYLTGSGGLDENVGKNIAQKGVIVVSINYRLGSFGFLVHPLLTAESPDGTAGNYGLLDQIAALRWVNENITAFGGDPYKITIIGQGEGAASVTALLLNPKAKGLFHRAIIESGAIFGNKYILPNTGGSHEKAIKTGEDLTIAVGCSTMLEALNCLRSESSEKILRAVSKSVGPLSKGLQFGPVFDNLVFPNDPKMMFESGRFNKVPVLIGVNADEGSIFVEKTTVSQYKTWIINYCRGLEDKALKLFPAKDKKDAEKSFNKAFTAIAFVKPAKFIAQSIAAKNPKVYFYNFIRAPKTKKGIKMGSFHGAEIPYVFGNLELTEGYNSDDFDLSEKMMNYWVNFVYNGDPNSPDQPAWPQYDKESGQYLELGERISVRTGLYKEYDELLENIE